jgi:outer membrane protein
LNGRSRGLRSLIWLSLFQTLKESLGLLKPESRAAKEKEFQNKLLEFRRWGEDSQNEINQRRMELERNIASGLLEVIQKIEAEEKFNFILEKNEAIVLIASKSIDLTDRVIKVYDLQKK